MDKIFIKDLLIRGIIGINDWERASLQDILINIIIEFDVSKSARSDNIKDTLNYRSLTKSIIEYVENSKHYLVESLATEVARICCVEFKAPKSTVRIEKPNAIRFASSVGVEITRTAEDLI